MTEDIDFDRITVSEGVVDKNCGVRYTIGYKMEPGKTIQLCMKTPGNCWSSGVQQYNEKSPWKMGFKIESNGLGMYNSIAAKVEDLLKCSLTKGNAAADWINPKLITWKNEV